MQNSQKESMFSHKRSLESVSFHKYYLKTLFPSIFGQETYPRDDIPCSATHRNITYHCLRHTARLDAPVTEKMTLEAAKQTYFTGRFTRLAEGRATKEATVKLPFGLGHRLITQQISIFTVKDTATSEGRSTQDGLGIKSSSQSRLQAQSSSLLSQANQIISLPQIQTFSLMVVHHCTNEQLSWLNFVEQYRFQKQGVQNYFVYEAAFSYTCETSLFSFDQSSKALQLFYENVIYSSGNTVNRQLTADKFNNCLQKLAQASMATRTLELQSPSYNPLHRRELHLSPAQMATFRSLKPKAYAYFSTINKKRTANPCFIENLVCRMMGEGCKEEECWEAIKYYLDFEKRMREKYRWSDFAKFDRMQIFQYIGKDSMGRPVLLNRMRKVLCSQIDDFDLFLDYHLFLFEIHLQDHMEGWVDQFVVLADAADQLSDNTNLSFTKRIISEGFKILLGRPFRIVGFNLGLIGVLLHKVLRPLLPDSVNQSVKVFGNDRSQLMEELRTIMPDETIPEFLGGRNRTGDSEEGEKGSDKTNDHSPRQ